MSDWMETILVASRDAGILALVIGITIKLSGCRIPARFCYAAWLLVAVRLLMPVLPTSPFSWQQVLSESESTAANWDSKIQTTQSVAENEIPSLSISPPADATVEQDIPSLTSIETPQPAISPSASMNPWHIAAGVWICGAVGLLILGAGSTFRFHKRVRRLMKKHPKSAYLEMALKGIGGEFGWKKLPHLLITEAVDSPALFGLFRPRILMPPALLDDLSDFDLRLVLLHELGHWRRRDIPLNFVLGLAQTIHWFNPLVWWAFHRARIESERATDDWVLQRTGVEHSVDYGEMLLRLLARRAKPRAAFSGMVSVVESPGDLRQRMTAIGRFKGKSTALTAAISVMLLLGLAAVGLTQAPKTKNEEDKTTIDRDNPELAAGSFICRVIAPDKSAIPDAEVYVSIFSQIDGDPIEDLRLVGKTNSAGEVEVHSDSFVLENASLQLFARHSDVGYGARSMATSRLSPETEVVLNEGLQLRLYVLDENGKPVIGMRLRVVSVQYPYERNPKPDDYPAFFGEVPPLPPGFWNATTDSEGRCTIKGLPPGGYYVDHDDPKYAQIPGRHSYSFQHKTAPDSPEVEVQLLPSATVSGTVILPDGTPVEGASVEILEERSYKQGGSSAKTVSGQGGRYELQRLLPAKYSVRISPDTRLQKEWAGNLTSLTLGLGEHRQGFDMSLVKGGLVTGKLILADTRAPLSDCIVSFTSTGSDLSLANWSATTDGSGAFRCRIPPGKWTVYVAGMVPEGYTREVAGRAELETLLQVVDGGNYSANFEIPRESRVSGVVLDPSGNPVAGATVTCFDPPDRMSHPMTVKSDGDGRFHFKTPAGTETAELVAMLDDMVSPSGVKYPVGKDITLQLAAVGFEEGFASVSGRVVDKEGKPIKGARLWCSAKQAEGKLIEFVTDADGRYGSTRLLPGKLITFWASKEGYGQDAAQLDLEAGKASVAETIILPPADSQLSGMVVDHLGNPLPGAKVGASGNLQPDGVEVSTGPDGRFELTGLVEGWLNVTAADDTMIRDFGLIDTIRTRTGRNDLLLRIPAVPVTNELEKLVDFVGKPAPPLKAEMWLKSDPLPEKGAGKVRFIYFAGLDRPLIHVPRQLPMLQEFRDANPNKELEIILVHGAWPKEEVLEILAEKYPDFNLPIAIEPEEGAMSEKFGAQHWLYVVINQQNKVVFQSRSDFSRAKKKALSLLKTKK